MSTGFPIVTSIPDVPSGYQINGEWGLVVPIGRTNEVLNPSFELALTNYTAGAGSLVRSTVKQYHGVYSGAYTPSAALTDGFFYGTIAMTIGQFRAISCKFIGQANIPYALTVATTGGVDLVTYQFRATGRWQWIWLYWVETSTTTRRIYFRKNGSADTHTFYVDGVQSEVINAGEFVSTYIDGDQQGFLPNQFPVPYGWNGTPHASTSYRTALTRAGGYVLPFSRFGFLLTAIIGLGLPVPQNVVTEYARADGGYSTFTRKPSGPFSIVGNMSEGTARALRSSRSNLGQYLDRDVTPDDQQMLLRYNHTDDCANVSSDQVAIPCKYVSGFDGAMDNHFAQKVTMTFETYLPSIDVERAEGGALTAPVAVTNANFVVMRTAAGVWQALSTGLTGGLARCIMEMPNGDIIVGGDFTGAGGVANTNAIARYTPSTNTFSAIGTGVSGGVVYNLATDVAGTTIFAVGTFTLAGGVAGTKFAAKNIANVWSPLGAGFTLGTGLFAIAYLSPTDVFVGGDLTTAAGAADYNPTTNVLGGVLAVGGTQIRSLVLSPDLKTMYIGGTITSINAVTVANIGSYTFVGATVNTMAGGVNTTVDSIAIGLNGVVYAGGLFITSTAGATLNRIGQFNGVYWAPMGTGANNEVSRVAVGPDGTVWATGLFTTMGGVTLLGGVATWSGALWTFPDFVIPGTADCRAITILSDGTVYLGFNSSGSGSQGAATVLTNSGTARTYPIFRFYGPATGVAALYLLLNRTTNRQILFNYSLQPGEVLQLSLQPDNLSFTSNERGSIMYAIQPGSNIASFFLNKGANNVAFYAGSITADAFWNPSLLSLDDLQ